MFWLLKAEKGILQIFVIFLTYLLVVVASWSGFYHMIIHKRYCCMQLMLLNLDQNISNMSCLLKARLSHHLWASKKCCSLSFCRMQQFATWIWQLAPTGSSESQENVNSSLVFVAGERSHLAMVNGYCCCILPPFTLMLVWQIYARPASDKL